MAKKNLLTNIIKDLLEQYPYLRDSDKYLIWNVWERQGVIHEDFASGKQVLDKENFLKALNPGSITRCRRKVQEEYPLLKASKRIEIERRRKEREKGRSILQTSLI